MTTLKVCLILILLILLIKSIYPIIIKLTRFTDEKIKFISTVKKETINKMTNLEFISFCKWIFEGDPSYSSVEVLPNTSKDLIHLILTDGTKCKSLVVCSRISMINTYNENSIVSTSDSDEICISSNLCKALVGELVANNLNQGFILTTGNIHIDAMEYLNKLHNNTMINIKILTIDDIIALMTKYRNNQDYTIAVNF